MPCDLLETQEAACISGIGKISNPIGLLQLIAQLSCERADAETTNAIVDSFVTRSGISDQTQIDALTVLVQAARDNGWWSKCDFIYPFVGGTAGAHAQNLKSSSFTITWAGTVTHDANGITGNGSTGYGDTGYIPSSSGQIELNSAHGSVYRRSTGTSGNRHYYGSTIAGGHSFIAGRTFSATTIAAFLNSMLAFSASSTSLGVAICSRLDAANIHVFNAGLDKSGAVVSTQIPNIPLFVLANNSVGVPATFSNANLAFATVGSGITFAEYQVMAADIQTFQTALGRAV